MKVISPEELLASAGAMETLILGHHDQGEVLYLDLASIVLYPMKTFPDFFIA